MQEANQCLFLESKLGLEVEDERVGERVQTTRGDDIVACHPN